MNKGLFAHIIATVIFICCSLYIIGDNEIDMFDRGMIVFMFVITHLIAGAICDVNDYYDQKMNK